MKTKQVLLLATAILFWIVTSYAQNIDPGLTANIEGFAQNTNIVWGAATNGIRSGQEIINLDRWGENSSPTAPLSSIFLQNVGTNNVVFRVRYKAELIGPDGNSVKAKPGQEMRGHYMPHTIPGPRPRETSGIDSFSIPDVFQVRTNGIHQLIISMQAATNKWHGTLTYFDLPPVTNSFRIGSSQPLGVKN